MHISRCPFSEKCGDKLYFCPYPANSKCMFGGCDQSEIAKPVQPLPDLVPVKRLSNAEIKEEAIKLYKQGWTVLYIADKLDKYESQIRDWLHAANIPLRKRKSRKAGGKK